MTDDTIRDHHDHIHDEPPDEGLKRRHVLACMAWAGTGLVWTLAGDSSRPGHSPKPRLRSPRRDRRRAGI